MLNFGWVFEIIILIKSMYFSQGGIKLISNLSNARSRKKKGWWIETCKLCTFWRLPSDTKNEYYFMVFPVQFWPKSSRCRICIEVKIYAEFMVFFHVSSPTPCTSRHALLYNAIHKKKLHDMMPLDSLSLQSLLVKLLDTFFKDLRASGSPIAAHYPSHQGFQSPG